MSQMNQPAAEVILEARNITKRYPGNVALDCVMFRVYRGQVNVLIGENGAGKSTLMLRQMEFRSFIKSCWRSQI